MWRTLAPNDKVLHYDNYLHAHISKDHAVFDRCFDPEWYCGLRRDANEAPRGSLVIGPWPSLQNPGTLVELRTNAARVRATLEYKATCDVGCPSNSGPPPAGTTAGCAGSQCRIAGSPCYIPGPVEAPTCQMSCEPTVYVDGVRQALPAAGLRKRYDGVVTFDLLTTTTGASTSAERHVELVMPWGGVVQINSLELYDDGQLTYSPAPPRRPFTYLAYGDSTTQGFCGDLPYPDQVGRVNNWRTINLGWGGLVFKPAQGPPIGQIPADLISIALGTNNWPSHTLCDIGPGLSQTLDGIRAGQPQTPIGFAYAWEHLQQADLPYDHEARC